MKGERELIKKLEDLTKGTGKALDIGEMPDYRKLIEEELLEYRTKNQFRKYDGYRSFFYLENLSNSSSIALYERMTKENIKFQYVERVVPLESIFPFSEERILKSLAGLEATKTYKILYEGRLTTNEMKTKIFSIITSNLKNKVQLNSPYYTIVVQVFKNNVGIAVIENEKGNFNFSLWESNKTEQQDD